MGNYLTVVFSRDPADVTRLLAPFEDTAENDGQISIREAEESIAELRTAYEAVKHQYPSFEDYLMQVYGYLYCTDLDIAGTIVRTGGKWGCWEIGGHFSHQLKLKSGCIGRSYPGRYVRQRMGYCDQAMVRDCIFDVDPVAYRDNLRFWEIVVEGKPLKRGERQPYLHARPSYYTQRFDSKEEYARCMASLNPWAFITPDGMWHEAGELTQFGIGLTNKNDLRRFRTLLNTMLTDNPDLWITIVDCHI